MFLLAQFFLRFTFLFCFVLYGIVVVCFLLLLLFLWAVTTASSVSTCSSKVQIRRGGWVQTGNNNIGMACVPRPRRRLVKGLHPLSKRWEFLLLLLGIILSISIIVGVITGVFVVGVLRTAAVVMVGVAVKLLLLNFTERQGV